MPGGVPGGVLGGILGGVPGGAPSGSQPLIVSGDVKAPELLHKVKPGYPEVARRARVTGTVILQAVIGESGDVEGITILRSRPLLDEAAVAAVRQWKYKPATLNGVPVKVYFTVTVEFILS